MLGFCGQRESYIKMHKPKRLTEPMACRAGNQHLKEKDFNEKVQKAGVQVE